MLKYNIYEQSMSDKFGVWMLQKASKLNSVKEHSLVNFKFIYTSKLSENYTYPDNVLFEKLNINGLIVEKISLVDSKDKYALIQLHGGAYVLEYNDTYRKVAKTYLGCKKDLTVFSPRYSLAPTHPYPAALNESVSLYKYLLNKGYKSSNIIIAGDSAGGGLAIALTLYLRDHLIPLPKALITMSPWTNLAMNGKSHEENKYKDLLLGNNTKPLDVEAYTQGKDVKNPYISPRYGDYKEFVDMLMFVGGDEILLSDTLDIADLAKNYNEIEVYNFKGMFHVFPLAFNKMSSSRTVWKIIEEYLNKKLREK